jgi:hypothetical protein
MVAIAGLLIGLIGSAILGAVILAVIPSFRLTMSNLLVFVVGAFLGMFALANLVERTLNALGLLKPMPIQTQNHFTGVLALLGALMGGTTLVWLKMRLRKTREKNQIS